MYALNAPKFIKHTLLNMKRLTGLITTVVDEPNVPLISTKKSTKIFRTK
jgi:hypothetical protein